MVYRGHVRNGKIELDRAVSLPDGCEVEFELRVTDSLSPRPTNGHSKDFRVPGHRYESSERDVAQRYNEHQP